MLVPQHHGRLLRAGHDRQRLDESAGDVLDAVTSLSRRDRCSNTDAVSSRSLRIADRLAASSAIGDATGVRGDDRALLGDRVVVIVEEEHEVAVAAPIRLDGQRRGGAGRPRR